MNMTSVSTSGGVKVVKLVRVCGARMRTTSRASCSFNTSLSTPLTTQALDLRVKRVANTSGRTRCVTRALFGGGTMEPLPALKEIKLKDIENRPIKVCYFFPLRFLPFYVMLSFRSTDTHTHTHTHTSGRDVSEQGFACGECCEQLWLHSEQLQGSGRVAQEI